MRLFSKKCLRGVQRASSGALACGLALGLWGCQLDDGYEYDEGEACEEPDILPFTGMLHTSAGTIEFDTVDVNITYGSLDEPCVTEIFFWFRKSNELSCSLTISAKDYLDGSGALIVDRVTFDGTAACPGFPESMQGDYVGLDLVGGVTVDPVRPPDKSHFFGCHDDAITLSLAGAMHRAAPWGHEDAVETFTIEEAEFVIEGPIYATSEPSSCPVAR